MCLMYAEINVSTMFPQYFLTLWASGCCDPPVIAREPFWGCNEQGGPTPSYLPIPVADPDNFDRSGAAAASRGKGVSPHTPQGDVVAAIPR